MSVEFFQTRMGRQFYEGTLPELVKQLVRINENLEQRAAVPHVRQATEDLVAAADHILDTEIVPGSDTTTTAFRELRRAVRATRDLMHEVTG